MNVAVGDRSGRIDRLESGNGSVEEFLVPRGVERWLKQRDVSVDADKPFDLISQRREVRRLGDGTVAGEFVFLSEAQIIGLVADRYPVLAKEDREEAFEIA